MEDQDQIQNQSERSFTFGDYWPSVALIGVIFGFIMFLIGLGFGYYQISSEPTGSFFTPATLSPMILCLFMMFAAPPAVWHFTKEVSPYIKLGQGAIIGFLTGAVLVVVSTVLNELWHFIDPDYTEKIIESTVANFERMDLPAEQKNMMIDGTVEGMKDSRNILTSLFYGIPIYGLLNLVTGLISVKIFGKKEDQSF